MTERIKRPVFEVSVIAIMIFQVAALFARSMLELSLMDDGYSRAVAEDLSYLVVPPILLLLMFPYLKRCKEPLLSLFRRNDLTVRLVVFAVLLGLSLRLTYWATLTVLIALGVVRNPDPDAMVGPILGFQCPPPGILLLSIVVMAVLIPVIEEVVNRGFILHRLLPMGRVVSVAATAILFAVLHKPGTYPVAFVVGVILAIQTLNFRSLWGAVIAHAAFNAAAVLDWECFRIVWNPPVSDPALIRLAAFSAPVALLSISLAVLLASEKAAGAAKCPGGKN